MPGLGVEESAYLEELTRRVGGPGLPHHVSFDPAEDPPFWFVVDVAIARQRGLTSRAGRRRKGFPGCRDD